MDETTRRINEHILRNLPDRGGNPERRRVLELNQDLRKDSALKGLPGDDWGYVALNIPVEDHAVLMIRFPDMASPDAEIAHRAVMKFLASPESEPYRVRRNDGKKGLPRRGVIVR
jgi:hypothetical protein